MPRGASPKREHEFEKLKHQFQHEHRYAGREEEVAARIVNKQRSEAGETKSADNKSVSSNRSSSTRRSSRPASGKSGTSGRRSSKASAGMHAGNPRLSVKEYAGLTIPEVTPRLAHLTLSQIRRLRDYELAHKHRKGMLDKLNRKLVH
jgi:hypothetical protein